VVTGVLTYGSDESARVDGIYRTPQMREQRARTVEMLAVRPGETVVDLGCGPGLLAVELARAGGCVLAVDVSPDMLARTAAHARSNGVAGRVWPARLDVTALALAVGSVDAVVAVQTLEWVPGIAAALTEAWRVLRPGGRILVLDTDWSRLQWHSDDPARLGRLRRAWSAAAAWPTLPASLPGRLRRNGFVDIRVSNFPIGAARLDPDGYVARQIAHMLAVVRDREAVTDDEAAAIAAEQVALSAADRFSFRLDRTIVTARRPVE
jgi:SAM-dependent methyltransferase